MVGYTLLTTTHFKLQRLEFKILSFGRINITFMGDFLQFPPINDTPLYSTNIQPFLTFKKLTQNKSHR
jgi:hypothetical protein